jgi:hypothetical protein
MQTMDNCQNNWGKNDQLKKFIGNIICKKRLSMNGSVISNSFGAINPYKTCIIYTKKQL